jgi:hypothetical protein
MRRPCSSSTQASWTLSRWLSLLTAAAIAHGAKRSRSLMNVVRLPWTTTRSAASPDSWHPVPRHDVGRARAPDAIATRQRSSHEQPWQTALAGYNRHSGDAAVRRPRTAATPRCRRRRSARQRWRHLAQPRRATIPRLVGNPVGLFVGLFCQPTSRSWRFVAVARLATGSAELPAKRQLSCKPADAGGGTRTPDTRIMIPLL